MENEYMRSVLHFNIGTEPDCHNSKNIYDKFIDYAFDKADYFMLVFINFYNKGYSEKQIEFKRNLEPFIVKVRTNPSWPGTPCVRCPNTSYEVAFYRTDEKAKAVLKKVECISDWSRPGMPEDLAFFIGDKCWFYSVGHEKIAAIIYADNDDINFVCSNGLASRQDVFIPKDTYYEQFDEDLLVL